MPRIVTIAASIIFAPILAAQADPVAAYDAGQRLRYSTTGHTKAAGVNLTLEYPATWVAKEGERPHIVQKFLPAGNENPYMVSIVVAGGIPSISSDGSGDEQAAQTLCEEDIVRGMISAPSSFLATSATTLEARPAC